MKIGWDDVWVKLQRIFASVEAEVLASTSGVATNSGRTTAVMFPFGAYLSFGSEGDATREDVVVSVDCKEEGSSVACTCDIARGDGYVLIDGPACTVGKKKPDVTLSRWVVEVGSFLRSNTGTIQQALSEGES